MFTFIDTKLEPAFPGIPVTVIGEETPVALPSGITKLEVLEKVWVGPEDTVKVVEAPSQIVALFMAEVTVGLTIVITLENTYGAQGAPGAKV